MSSTGVDHLGSLASALVLALTSPPAFIAHAARAGPHPVLPVSVNAWRLVGMPKRLNRTPALPTQGESP